MISTEDAAGNASSHLFTRVTSGNRSSSITNSWTLWLLVTLEQENPLWLSCGIRNVTGNLLSQVFNSLCVMHVTSSEKQKQTDFLVYSVELQTSHFKRKEGKVRCDSTL